ncbi:hypothetical protein GGR51DRAFT_543418 [Nemania sp. FL0031]|nr:hypothetical protein GGR51DRAFT_543418 [Nemania sp. FL0031]
MALDLLTLALPVPPPTAVRTSFAVSSGRPRPTCRDSGSCGHICERNCGPPGVNNCVGPGCHTPGGGGGGGGGIHFCIGPWCLPGSGSCLGSSCPGSCVGLGCSGGGGGGGEGDPEDCPSPSTVADCQVVCTTSPTPKPCSTTCFDVVGCDVTGTTTTTNKATGTPAPGFEVRIDDGWEIPNYDALDAALPALLPSLRDESSKDHENKSKSHGVTATPTSSGVDPGTTSSPTDFPTLTSNTPSTPDPYTGTECKSYTTTGQSTLCVPKAACPPAYTASGTPECPGDQYCLKTTIYTRCAKVTGRGVTGIDLRTATTTGSPAVEATPTITPEPELEPLLPVPDMKPKLQVDLDSISDLDLDSVLPSNQTSTPLNQLFARQDGCGGSANGGCDLIPFCDICATKLDVPCINIYMDAITGPLSGTDIKVVINEDGEDVCTVKKNCADWDEDCTVVGEQCGHKYTMSFKYNYVAYYSPKYGDVFPFYLERDKTDEFILCTQKVGSLEVASGCLEDTFKSENGPCNSKKREAPTFPSINGFGDGSDGLWATTPEDEYMPPFNLSLHRRALEARAFADFNSDPTCTTQQMNKLAMWIDDVLIMTQAAMDAITDLQQNTAVIYPPQIEAIATTMNNLVGIDYYLGGPVDWQLLKDDYQLIQDFALGIFPQVPQGQKPWIFCGDHFAVPNQWTDFAKDERDQYIPDTRNPGQYLRLQQVGQYYQYFLQGKQPYRVPAMGKYIFGDPGAFDPGRPTVTGQQGVAGAICSRDGNNPAAVTMHSTLGFPIIMICSPMNRNNLDGFTVYREDIMLQVALRPGNSLDRHRPGSATMLHEFMHAARAPGTTPDEGRNSQECFDKSVKAPLEARNSPECLALFAVAMYFQRFSLAAGGPHHFSNLYAQAL